MRAGKTPGIGCHLLLVMVLGLLVRGGVVVSRFDQLAADPDAYRAIAVTLATHGVFGQTSATGEAVPSAFRPPLYPAVLSGLVTAGQLTSASVAVLHVIMGVVTAVLTFLICHHLLARRDSVNHSLACSLAAGLVIIDPILLQQSALVMTETLATLLAAAVIYLWARAWSGEASQSGRRQFATNTSPKRKRVDALGQITRLRVGLVGDGASDRTGAVQLIATSAASIGWAIAMGVLLSLAYLCRPTFLVWAVLIAAQVALVPHLAKTRRVLHFLVIAGLVGSVVAGWTMRNLQRFGRPIWATTHGGYTLLLANNPLFYDYLRDGRWGKAWDAEPFRIAYSHRHEGDPRSEAFWYRDWSSAQATAPGDQNVSAVRRRADAVDRDAEDRLAYEAAMATIRREPGQFLWSCLVRAGRLFSPLPHLTPDRSPLVVWLVGGYYLLMYVAVILGLWRLGRRITRPQWWPILTLALSLTVVHAVYWSNLRMRAPLIPGLAIIASIGLVRMGPTADGPSADEPEGAE